MPSYDVICPLNNLLNIGADSVKTFAICASQWHWENFLPGYPRDVDDHGSSEYTIRSWIFILIETSILLQHPPAWSWGFYPATWSEPSIFIPFLSESPIVLPASPSKHSSLWQSQASVVPEREFSEPPLPPPAESPPTRSLWSEVGETAAPWASPFPTFINTIFSPRLFVHTTGRPWPSITFTEIVASYPSSK